MQKYARTFSHIHAYFYIFYTFLQIRAYFFTNAQIFAQTRIFLHAKAVGFWLIRFCENSRHKNEPIYLAKLPPLKRRDRYGRQSRR